MKIKGRIISLFTAVAMIMAMAPQMTVFADSNTYGAFTVTGDDLTGVSYSSNVLTISSGDEYTIAMASATSTSTDRIQVTASSDVTITLDSVNITSSSNSPFIINATGDVTIKLSGTNVLKSTSNSSGYVGYAGLQKTSTSNTLTITSVDGDGSTNGALTANGSSSKDYTGVGGAGIGGGNTGSGNNITIAGGTVTATGGKGSAGIGGGGRPNSGGSIGNGYNIVITGGMVTATGGTSGAGIGGGRSGVGTVTITGGYIKATNGTGASAIGSGSYGSSSTVIITGGYFGSGTTGVSGTGKVYSCNIASWCAVFSNTDGNTSSTYPYYVAELVTISGDAVCGETLTANTYSTLTNVSYQWLRDGDEITGATGQTYTLTVDDAGCTISVKVTYDDSATVTSDTVTVAKVDPEVTAPTAKTLTYNGSAQDLITAGTTTGGTMYYSLTGDSDWSEDIPTGTNVGSYSVYYKVVGNDNYNDVAVGGPISVTISKATPEVTAPTATNPTYNGSAQDLVTAGSTTGGTMYYSTEENGTYSTTIPTGTDAGTYTVYYKVFGDDNYNDYTPADNSVSVTISKADQGVPSGLEVTQPDETTSTGTISGVTTYMEYNTDNGDTWIEITGTTLTVNPGKVYIRYAADENHNAGAVAEITISASDPSYTTPSDLTATYGDTLDDVELPTAENGTWTWEDSSLSVGNVGTNTFMAVFTPKDGNYNTVTVEVSITVAAAASSVETAPTANTLTYNGSAQELVTAGEANGGEMQYSLDKDSGYSTTIPTGTSAGDYTVYYKVVGDNNHNDSDVYSVEVTIAKKSSSSSGGSSHSLSQTTSSSSSTDDTDDGTTDTTDTTTTTETTGTTDTTTTDTTTTDDYVIGGDGGTTTATAAETFTDVVETNRYVDAIDYVVNSGLMAGTSSTTFEPETSLTRGMIVTIFHRLEGEPESDSDHGFNDVEDSAWYATAVAWAAENGVVEGYGDGSFGPDDAVTREQLAAILYRYAEYKGYDISAIADLGGYIDADDIGDWARSAMEWANAEALLDVKGFSYIVPQGEASRGETASTLMTFVENIAK